MTEVAAAEPNASDNVQLTRRHEFTVYENDLESHLSHTTNIFRRLFDGLVEVEARNDPSIVLKLNKRVDELEAQLQTLAHNITGFDGSAPEDDEAPPAAEAVPPLATASKRSEPSVSAGHPETPTTTSFADMVHSTLGTSPAADDAPKKKASGSTKPDDTTADSDEAVPKASSDHDATEASEGRPGSPPVLKSPAARTSLVESGSEAAVRAPSTSREGPTSEHEVVDATDHETDDSEPRAVEAVDSPAVEETAKRSSESDGGGGGEGGQGRMKPSHSASRETQCTPRTADEKPSLDASTNTNVTESASSQPSSADDSLMMERQGRGGFHSRSRDPDAHDPTHSVTPTPDIMRTASSHSITGPMVDTARHDIMRSAVFASAEPAPITPRHPNVSSALAGGRIAAMSTRARDGGSTARSDTDHANGTKRNFFAGALKVVMMNRLRGSSNNLLASKVDKQDTLFSRMERLEGAVPQLESMLAMVHENTGGMHADMKRLAKSLHRLEDDMLAHAATPQMQQAPTAPQTPSAVVALRKQVRAIEQVHEWTLLDAHTVQRALRWFAEAADRAVALAAEYSEWLEDVAEVKQQLADGVADESARCKTEQVRLMGVVDTVEPIELSPQTRDALSGIAGDAQALIEQITLDNAKNIPALLSTFVWEYADRLGFQLPDVDVPEGFRGDAQGWMPATGDGATPTARHNTRSSTIENRLKAGVWGALLATAYATEIVTRIPHMSTAVQDLWLELQRVEGDMTRLQQATARASAAVAIYQDTKPAEEPAAVVGEEGGDVGGMGGGGGNRSKAELIARPNASGGVVDAHEPDTALTTDSIQLEALSTQYVDDQIAELKRGMAQLLNAGELNKAIMALRRDLGQKVTVEDMQEALSAMNGQLQRLADGLPPDGTLQELRDAVMSKADKSELDWLMEQQAQGEGGDEAVLLGKMRCLSCDRPLPDPKHLVKGFMHTDNTVISGGGPGGSHGAPIRQAARQNSSTYGPGATQAPGTETRSWTASGRRSRGSANIGKISEDDPLSQTAGPRVGPLRASRRQGGGGGMYDSAGAAGLRSAGSLGGRSSTSSTLRFARNGVSAGGERPGRGNLSEEAQRLKHKSPFPGLSYPAPARSSEAALPPISRDSPHSHEPQQDVRPVRSITVDLSTASLDATASPHNLQHPSVDSLNSR